MALFNLFKEDWISNINYKKGNKIVKILVKSNSHNLYKFCSQNLSRFKEI